jgi:phosphatidylserine/phosphatidylglycerophosphate/cardiolipin synthase-like enzyme|tara:strand:- start:7640 stop:8782 length:1143 start_codon:yes stop_codon:yes gene_type:complete
MEELLKGIYNVVKDQHPDKIKTLSNKIRVISKAECSALKGFFNTDHANRALDTLLSLWSKSDCSSVELASLLFGVSYGSSVASNNQSTELVWTGPDANLFPVRRSEQVLLDLINSAQDTLFIVSFVLVNIQNVEKAIDTAVKRGVNVRMLLESEDKEGSNGFIDTINRLYVNIPNLKLYIWPRKNREYLQGGFARVHAKCAVADRRLAFITSANLTAAALDRNIEMGVNIEGGSIPENIFNQLSSMINSKEIIRYKPSASSVSAATKKNNVVRLEELPSSIQPGTYFEIEFENKKTGLKELRKFIVCDENKERPEAGTIVIIRHENNTFMGKYRWSKQQNTDDNQPYYIVTVKGFGPTERIKIDESEWLRFKPLAMEAIK